ncbi:hypothetical protein KAOT1_18157 [Kordia algicida OT-1]|uniref:Uncharacterized protein n=1 Tax=Kordia algicida OT-1 TaxID=391587 RepID=A9DN49_9FLAO|nr:hypothetical protein KAOT1_18157 [Kordia algicida OT-1]
MIKVVMCLLMCKVFDKVFQDKNIYFMILNKKNPNQTTIDSCLHRNDSEKTTSKAIQNPILIHFQISKLPN